MKKAMMIAVFIIVIAVIFTIPLSLYAAPGGNGMPAVHARALGICDQPPYNWFGPAVAGLATSYPGAVAAHVSGR
jgi:hypothetical protein